MDHRDRVKLLVRVDVVLGPADIDLASPLTTNDDALDLVRLQVLVQDLARGHSRDRTLEMDQAFDIAARLLRRVVQGKLSVPGARPEEFRDLLAAVEAALV